MAVDGDERSVGAPGATDDERQLAAFAAALVEAVDSVVEEWVRRCVQVTCVRAGVDLDRDLVDRTEQAAVAARADVAAGLAGLFAVDVDAQAGTPLQVLRGAVRFPTEVLRGAGVPPLDRDEFDRRAFPEDIYGLTPAGFADVDPALVEPSITWGAAKAHVHLRRHARS